AKPPNVELYFAGSLFQRVSGWIARPFALVVSRYFPLDVGYVAHANRGRRRTWRARCGLLPDRLFLLGISPPFLLSCNLDACDLCSCDRNWRDLKPMYPRFRNIYDCHRTACGMRCNRNNLRVNCTRIHQCSEGQNRTAICCKKPHTIPEIRAEI